MPHINPHITTTPRQHFFELLTEYIIIFLALGPFALMVNWIFIPANFVGGGLTGICSIIYYATQGAFPTLFAQYNGAIPVWLSSFSINAILLLIAAKVLGWRFSVRTIWGVICLTFWYWLIPIRETSLIEEPMVACVVGGLAFGTFLGIVMSNNGSSGGTDIVAMLVSHKWDISIGRVFVICDAIIIISGYFLPVPDAMQDIVTSDADYKLRRVLYGICLTISCSIAVDWILARSRQSVQFMIFSARYAEIATQINTQVKRGVTILDGKGWYSKQPMHVVTVLASKQESHQILRIIHDLDPNAFVSCANVSGVFGAGFEPIKTK